jgi:cyanate permease
MKGIVLLVFHTALLKRVCRRILGKITVPGRAEAGWTFALDIVAVIAAILAAVYLMMSVSAKRYRCDRRGGCDTVNIYPNHPSWDTVVYLFYAIGYVTAVFFFLICIFTSKPLIPLQGHILTIDRRGLVTISSNTASNTLHDKNRRWPTRSS